MPIDKIGLHRNAVKKINVIAFLTASMMLCACNEETTPQKPQEPEIPSGPICGNQIVEPGEACDYPVGVPLTCAEYDSTKTWASGKPSCSADCKTILPGTCFEQMPPQCGNRRLDTGELCDGAAGVPLTCAEYDSSKEWASGGHPACASNCKSLIPNTCVEKPGKNCGNNILDSGELCDGFMGIPATCEAFDNTREWLPGGKPGCSNNCLALDRGSCVEKHIICGNGIIEAGEICDSTQGVPETCEAFDSSKTWRTGTPKCSADCKQIEKGTCEESNLHEITFANWNVQVDYESWGGKPVENRAKTLYEAMKTWPHRPNILAIIEASPCWHRPDIFAYFEDLGYTWADTLITEPWATFSDFTCGENNQNAFLEGVTEHQAASCFLLTDILYQKDEFDLIDMGYVELFPPKDWDGLPENCMLHIHGNVCSTYEPGSVFTNNKTIAFAAVLKEKATDELFIAVSTHWNPNNGTVPSEAPAGIIGPVADNERVRVYGAIQMANMINELRQKYPEAHVIAGGDFNTVDLSIVYKNEVVTSAITALVSLMGCGPSKITDSPTLLATLNCLMNGLYEADRLPIDFKASHQTFMEEANLIDARSKALADIPGTIDTSTASDPSITQYTDVINLTLVIDYTFYSPEMNLLSYEVKQGDAYHVISDHSPVVTRYQYDIKK